MKEKQKIKLASETVEMGKVSKKAFGARSYREQVLGRPGLKPTFPSKKKPGKPTTNDKEVVDPKRVAFHDTGAGVIRPIAMRSRFHRKKYEKKREQFKKTALDTARSELLNREQEGFLEADDDEETHNIRQQQIADAVDLASASKFFELNLEQYGPYHIDYTDNGRHLLIGGRKGHVAAFDWHTKKLHCEFNAMEQIRDVKWLHTENIYAVAQKNYTYVYDNQGTELHCLKNLYEAQNLQFLPRHFLLVGGCKNSYLVYVDVSIGKMVTSFPTRNGPLAVMCVNPANAIVHSGHGDGTVSLWSPNVKEPLVKMLTHRAALSGITVDESGKYMVTTGIDRHCKVWDVRMYRQLHSYTMPTGLSSVAVSQKLVVACGVGNTVQLFKDMHLGICESPYLTHRVSGAVTDLYFVPYEDVLGVGHGGGMSSILVPGSGEPNVDAYRANPYETKSQRREREIKQLLDKLQPELICIDPDEITRVNEDVLEREMEERKKLLYVRPLEVQYTPKHKMRGRGTGKHKELRKETVKGEVRFERNKERNDVAKEVFGDDDDDVKTEAVEETQTKKQKKNVLDRFKH